MQNGSKQMRGIRSTQQHKQREQLVCCLSINGRVRGAVSGRETDALKDWKGESEEQQVNRAESTGIWRNREGTSRASGGIESRT